MNSFIDNRKTYGWIWLGMPKVLQTNESATVYLKNETSYEVDFLCVDMDP